MAKNQAHLMSSHSSTGDLAWSTGVSLLALAVFSCGWFEDFSGLGSHTAVGAERVLRGEVPYRDFWTMYAPGHFYLLAAVFKIFGVSLAVEMVAASVVCALAAGACYWTVLRLSAGRLVALFCSAVFIAATYNTGYYLVLKTYPPSALLIFAALGLFLGYLAGGKTVQLAASGAVTGLLVVFKHDVGGYTAIAIAVGLLVHQLLNPGATNRYRSALAAMACYGVALLVVAAPVAIWFAAVAGADMLQDLIVFPLTDFKFSRPERYPALFSLDLSDAWRLRILFNVLHWVEFAFPSLIAISALPVLAFAGRTRRPFFLAVGATLSTAWCLHFSAAHVQINTHIITLSVYAAILASAVYACCLRGRLPSSRRSRVVPALGGSIAALWLVALCVEPTHRIVTRFQLGDTQLELPRVAGVMVGADMADDLKRLAEFVESHSTADDPLYVGLHRHDALIVSDSWPHNLLARPVATRYHELHPAIVDKASVQLEMVGDLREQAVPLLVLVSVFPDENLEKFKAELRRDVPEVGATVLDDFIRDNYVQARTFGRYAVWLRN